MEEDQKIIEKMDLLSAKIKVDLNVKNEERHLKI